MNQSRFSQRRAKSADRNPQAPISAPVQPRVSPLLAHVAEVAVVQGRHAHGAELAQVLEALGTVAAGAARSRAPDVGRLLGVALRHAAHQAGVLELDRGNAVQQGTDGPEALAQSDALDAVGLREAELAAQLAPGELQEGAAGSWGCHWFIREFSIHFPGLDCILLHAYERKSVQREDGRLKNW